MLAATFDPQINNMVNDVLSGAIKEINAQHIKQQLAGPMVKPVSLPQ